MKRIIALMLIVYLGFVGCKKNEENKIPMASNLPAGTHAVKVLEFMDVANYTYMKVSENGNEFWLAAPQTKVEKDEVLYYSQAMEMKNFHSQSLNRTFPSIFFVQSVSANPQAQTLSSAHQQSYSSKREQISVEPVKGGVTIAQIYSRKDQLKGETVKIIGKVVKYNPSIMNRNWVHIQDGTESGGNFDLLVTTNDSTSLGKIIVVEGKVALNQDFGAGYSYPVMIEAAKIRPN